MDGHLMRIEITLDEQRFHSTLSESAGARDLAGQRIPALPGPVTATVAQDD